MLRSDTLTQPPIKGEKWCCVREKTCFSPILLLVSSKKCMRETVRFYRTTQRVAFKTSPKSPVVEIDWQAIVPYVKTRKLRGSVGLSHISLDVVHSIWHGSIRKATNSILFMTGSLVCWKCLFWMSVTWLSAIWMRTNRTIPHSIKWCRVVRLWSRNAKMFGNTSSTMSTNACLLLIYVICLSLTYQSPSIIFFLCLDFGAYLIFFAILPCYSRETIFAQRVPLSWHSVPRCGWVMTTKGQ